MFFKKIYYRHGKAGYIVKNKGICKLAAAYSFNIEKTFCFCHHFIFVQIIRNIIRKNHSRNILVALQKTVTAFIRTAHPYIHYRIPAVDDVGRAGAFFEME